MTRLFSISWQYFTFLGNPKLSQLLKLKNMNEKRFVDHDTSVEDYVGIFENKNTRGKIAGNALRNEKSDEREMQTIEPAELNKHLADFIRSVRRKDGEDFESSSLSLKMINKNLNLTMYIIHNTTWRVLCTVFTHSFLHQKFHSFAALTRSISDKSTAHAQIP